MFSGGVSDSVGIDLDHFCAVRIEPVDHFFQEVAAEFVSLRGFEIGECS